MESGLKVSRRRKFGALFMLLGLLTATFSVFGPQAIAEPVPGDANGTITGFEIEGNQSSDGNALDWEDLVGSDTLTVVTDDTTDTGLQGSSKEDDPSGWACNSGGANPPKNNILHAAVNTRVGPGGAFLDLSYMREGQTGNAHINFEFNQQPIATPCPYLTRTTGDLLLLFNFPGGDGQANIAAFLWDASIGEDGSWVSTGIPANSAAAVSNGADVPDFIFPGVDELGNRQFGEASLNLEAILPTDEGECVSFGELNVRSRSSAGNQEEDSNSINSALQDRLAPTPIDLSTCGRIELEKTDDAGNALAGATFGLFGSEADAIAETNAIDTCVTDAQGDCTFDEVNPGNYWVTEISAPAGYDEDPTVVPVTVDALETVEIEYTFVDPRHTGFVEVTKVITGDGADAVDADELTGLRFFLTTNPGDAAVNTWPPPGETADCSLDGLSYSCVIGPVVLGTYWVNEDPTTLPDGLTAGPKVPVTVDEDGETVDVDYTNTINPIDITLEKAGPDTANVGDEITYTFDVTTTGEPLTNLVLEELTEGNVYADRCDTPLTGPTKTGGDQDAWLEVGETWTWTCKHTVTLADATDEFDAELLQNKAKVTGEDSFGRTVSDEDPHVVTILLPDVTVDKTPDDGVILPGDDAVFTIEVTNLGPGRANDVTLTDTLPDGITWTEDSADCSIAAGVLTCDFGDLEDGDSASVTVTGATDNSDCGELPNTATVSASNELSEDEGNNSDDGLITVSCADVTVEKVAQADPINAGDGAAFDITVTNLSDTVSATDVTLTDPLPSGIDWTEDSADCSIADDVLTCDFGTIEAGGTRTVTVSGPTDQADCGLLTNTATVSSTNEAEGADDNNESTDTITVNCPDIDIVKEAAEGVVSAGDPVSFTMTVTNDGPGDAYDVTLNDPLPGDIDWTDDSDACSITDAVLSCDFGTLGAGDSVSVTVTGTTDELDCTVLPNTATVDASNDDEEMSSDSIEVLCPGVNLNKFEDSDLVDLGDEVGFTISVTNTGPGEAKDVVVTDELPAGYDWSVDHPDCAIESGTLTCELGDLPAVEDGPQVTIHLTAPTVVDGVPVECAEVVNVAEATVGNGADPDPSEADLRVRCPIAIQIEKDGPDTAAVGDEITYTFEVTNTGGEDLSDIVLTDPICDEGTLVWLTQGDGDDILEKDGAETWTAECTRVIQATDPDPLPNTATVEGTDEWGRSTDDDDDHEVDILPEVAPQVIPRALPRTGADTDFLMLLAGGLLLLGGLLTVSTSQAPAFAARRRRS